MLDLILLVHGNNVVVKKVALPDFVRNVSWVHFFKLVYDSSL